VKILELESSEQIKNCFPVMSQLRPHIKKENFLETVKDQMLLGYQLAAVFENSQCVAIAGYRYQANMAWGKFLYVDDFVTDKNYRSKGAGKLLLNWLEDQAKSKSCNQLHLDSGVQRFDAHKFYVREGMEIRSHHFAMTL